MVATGAPQDEAALLRERLRAGTLEVEQLALAAYLGHAPARAALPGQGPWPFFAEEAWREWSRERGGSWREEWPPLVRSALDAHLETHANLVRGVRGSWGEGLKAWGPELTVRAAILCAELVLPMLLAAFEADGDSEGEHLQAALRATQDWLTCPCAQHAEAAREQGQSVSRPPYGLDAVLTSGWSVFENAAGTVWFGNPHSAFANDAVRAAARATSPSRVLGFLRRSLVPRALLPRTVE
jgi:hypothetical protein